MHHIHVRQKKHSSATFARCGHLAVLCIGVHNYAWTWDLHNSLSAHTLPNAIKGIPLFGSLVSHKMNMVQVWHVSWRGNDLYSLFTKWGLASMTQPVASSLEWDLFSRVRYGSNEVPNLAFTLPVQTSKSDPADSGFCGPFLLLRETSEHKCRWVTIASLLFLQLGKPLFSLKLVCWNWPQLRDYNNNNYCCSIQFLHCVPLLAIVSLDLIIKILILTYFNRLLFFIHWLPLFSFCIHTLCMCCSVMTSESHIYLIS